MTIRTAISFKQYYKLLFGLIYQKGIMRVIVAVDCLLLLWVLGYYLHFLPVPKPAIYQYIAIVLITVVQPAGIFLTIRRSFHSSNHFGEPLEITTTENELRIKGKSFYTELLWEKLFKITEVRTYILIYQNTLSAIIINKGDLTQAELDEFRNFLKTVPAVPVHLKRAK